MRIFPERIRDAMEPTGQAFIIIAGSMLAIAVCTFAFETWILYSWPRTTGTVISSRVATSTSDDGTAMCSAIESVQYIVDGRNLVLETGGHAFTSKCLEIEANVASVRGQSRTVLYNKHGAGTAYVNPAFTIEFYLISFALTCGAGAFGLAGWMLIRVSRWMVKKGIDFS